MWSIKLKPEQVDMLDGGALERWLEEDSDLGRVDIRSYGRAGDMGVGEVLQVIVQDGGVGLASLLVSVGAWIDAHRTSSKANDAPQVEVTKGDISVVISSGDPLQISAAIKALSDDRGPESTDK